MRRARTPRGPDVYAQLADRLKRMVRDEHHNNLTGAERFTVAHENPVALEQIAGDLRLEDGDPDFTIGAPLRAFITAHPLAVGDLVWCLREGQEWHMVDVVTDG